MSYLVLCYLILSFVWANDFSMYLDNFLSTNTSLGSEACSGAWPICWTMTKRGILELNDVEVVVQEAQARQIAIDGELLRLLEEVKKK